ncbi:type III-B CRISPR module RAMP protein Cmr6 [Thermobifida cellulosilytica]|uniref:CRISPR-associated protein Cmr6 n=1 Tax=Thermobifida cellulosilytica TB100 TaxID=665004 RepID=A0A147KMS8_THECS|nr:type III-B CRISPR module RAMP protein Cmr6 [Thermobifida cellulosilytica]KUP98586.1 CRISPR-associated protein Cmr6 [Thermobifida cellulosilytica TB100]
MTPPRNRRGPRPGPRNGASSPEESEVLSVRYAGPVGRVLSGSVREDRSGGAPREHGVLHYEGRSVLDGTANSLVVLRRLAVLHGSSDARAKKPVLDWAARHALGHHDTWAAEVARRRAHALRVLSARGRHVHRLELTADWRLVVGLGEQTGDHEFGVSLHGTYGWPVIPGSTLKGAAAAWARQQQVPAERYTEVFGSAAVPEDEEDSRGGRGRVRFLDALPRAGCEPRRRLRVHSDVITPHQHAYHTESGAEPGAPGEHHQPIPLPFLSLSGAFVADLVGDDPGLVREAAEWLAHACRENGIGARTTAGYGYLTATSTDDWEQP